MSKSKSAKGKKLVRARSYTQHQRKKKEISEAEFETIINKQKEHINERDEKPQAES